MNSALPVKQLHIVSKCIFLVVGILCFSDLVSSYVIRNVTYNTQSFLFGGSMYPIQKARHHVQLIILRDVGQSVRRTRCGGSLITPNIVLTANHCINKRGNIFQVVVYGGSDKYRKNAKKRQGIAFYTNPYSIKKNKSATDMAMIKLDKPFLESMIEPISLSLSPIKLNEKLTVTGFGRFDSSGEMSKFLKKLDGQVVECSKPNLAVCVAYYPGNGTCKGDSGSGWFNSEHKLVGVVSSRKGPCGNSQSYVATILHNLDFIVNALQTLSPDDEFAKRIVESIKKEHGFDIGYRSGKKYPKEATEITEWYDY